jgi:drug/metabolite transporter (DMT)-like permease
MKNAYISLIISAVLYGSISTIAKPSLNSINPILLSSLTYLIIGIFLTPFIKVSKYVIYENKNNSLKLIIITSICGAVIGPILFFYGLKLTDASISSLLINAEFVFSILLAFFILKEKPNRLSYIGIALVFVALIVLNFKGDISNIFENNNFTGNILILAATVFWALDNNISKIILQRETPVIKLIQLKSLFGGFISLLIVFLFGVSFTVSIYQIPNLLLLSLGGFAGSLFLFLKGMKEIGAIKSVMIFSTSSIFGVIFASLFLNESIEQWRLIFSLLMIMPGIYLISKNG